MSLLSFSPGNVGPDFVSSDVLRFHSPEIVTQVIEVIFDHLDGLSAIDLVVVSQILF